MTRVVVEVVGAHDLPPKSGRSKASPFVQVDFDSQRRCTAAKPNDLSPTWNEKLVFDVAHGGAVGLADRPINVSVYHRRPSGGKSCLGRVRLFGSTVAPSPDEATLMCCPLDKPSLFALTRGEVALRLYVVPYTSSTAPATAAANVYSTPYPPTFSDSASAVDPETIVGGGSTQSAPTVRKKKKPSRVYHSVANQSSAGSQMPPPPHYPKMPMIDEPRMPLPTTPSKGAKKAALADNAKTAPYLIVDQVEFLYVSVVRAKDLPGMDLIGGLDPYVEVRVGNYAGETRHLERNQNPEWNQVFAFSKEHLQADRLEVTIMDRNLVVRDNFVGKVILSINELPTRVPPGGPLAPQWYRLRDMKGELTRGVIMLAAWKGTQADQAFADAWHTGACDLTPSGELATRTKSYYSPRLCYLRCHVISAQDLVHPDRNRSRLDIFATVKLGAQLWTTRPSQDRSLSPKWDQEFFLVAAWPFDEELVITVNDIITPDRHQLLGTLVLPKGKIKTQSVDKKKFKQPPPAWFDLERPHSNGNGNGGNGNGNGNGWRHEFKSKIQLRVYYDAAYHVLDELTNYSSDFQPSARPLRTKAIGVLELGILRARDLAPMKPLNGRSAVDAYCVAKYGQKWVRTRTFRDNSSPSWQEQYTFEVFDPCTVLTVAVFDNNQLGGVGNSSRQGLWDTPLGKVRIQASTLDSGRTYVQPFSLFMIHPNGLLKCGELHLAVRFTCTHWVDMMRLYLRPQLPNEHFAKPIPPLHLLHLRRHAVDLIVARLTRAEPPLRPEVVHYILRDPSAHPSPAIPEHKSYSMRKSLAACTRLRAVLASVDASVRWFDGVRKWDNPITTILVIFVFLTLTWRPIMILPTFFLYLFAVGVWNYRWRPQRPPQMEHYTEGVLPDLLAEEFDEGPTSGTPPEIVMLRYFQLRGSARNLQRLVENVAVQGERVHALLSWRDWRATLIALLAVFLLGVVFYKCPFRAIVTVVGLYELRHPRLRRKGPSMALSFFKRLPSNADVML